MDGLKKRVIIVGAGFGGLNAAKILGRSSKVDLWVVDKRNHHLFQPLLYQVAMAGLSPAEIAAPIRQLLANQTNTRVIQGEVEAVDRTQALVSGDFGTLSYDYLILACGASHSYFGKEHWEEFAPGLKNLEQATEIRRRVLTAFERAERESDPAKRKAFLTFVIIGGGPTGVELAGAIGEMSRFTLARDFRNIDPKLTRVILVEGGKGILPSFSNSLTSRATRDLENLGVQVWTSSMVTQVDSEGVSIGDERIEAKTVLWAAGVRAATINDGLGVSLDRTGRAQVNPDMTIPGNPEIFVIGDQARFTTDQGQTLPGIAPVAVQQGRFVAKTILAEIAGKQRADFRYVDKGQMATIGRSKAIVQTGKLHLTGWFAWMAWLVVHIYYLSGFKNRLFVLFQWAWSYCSFKRGARLIVEKRWRSFPQQTAGDGKAQNENASPRNYSGKSGDPDKNHKPVLPD